MIRASRCWIAAAALALLPAVAAAIQPDRTGYAYRPDSSVLIYIEQHDETRLDGRVTRSTVTYRRPEGGVFATKKLDFTADRTGPAFRLENQHHGHVEGARHTQDGLVVFFRKSDDHEYVEERIALPRQAIIDGGFDRFVEANWDALLEGESFTRPFLLPSFQEFVDFRIYLERSGDATVVFVMEPASFWLRLVGGRIEVTYDHDTAALRRYKGVSNIRDENGENYEVRIEFPAADGAPAHSAAPASAGG